MPLLTKKDREKHHIEEIPGTLIEAVYETEKDPFIREVLGEYAFEKYIDLKKREWNAYRAQVSNWELEQYLNRY